MRGQWGYFEGTGEGALIATEGRMLGYILHVSASTSCPLNGRNIV
jgi:hypothetical protein